MFHILEIGLAGNCLQGQFFFMQEIQEKNKMIVEIYESIGFECEIREDMIKKETFAKIDVSCKCYHV